MAITKNDVILAPKEVKTLTETTTILLQNKNMRTGLLVTDVLGTKTVGLNESVVVDGNATVESPSYGSGVISVSSLSAFIPATSVDVSNTDVAYVGTTPVCTS